MSGRIDVTVAAVIEHDERFLLVEEHAGGRTVFNQPAGHLEPEESLLEAVRRETHEETGFDFTPERLLGVYLWRSTGSDVTFLRLAFCGVAHPPRGIPRLDEGIIATHWLTRNQLLSRENELRSPMVLRCIDDFRLGIRYPLELLTQLDLPRSRATRLA